jgi:hypothetical protein
MKRISIAAGLALLGAAALAVAGLQDYSLKRTPKEGETTKYKMVGTMEVLGQQVTLTATVLNKVLKVDNEVYSVESSQVDGKINFGGNEMELPNMGSTTTKYKADGTVLEVQGEGVEMGGYRMANLLSAIMPAKNVKVGDTWTSEVKADAKKGTVDVKGTYKFDSVEKCEGHDAAKITYEMKESNSETPAVVTGTVWIELKSGNMVKVDNAWKDVPVPGAPGPVSGKFTLTLVP